VKRKHTHIGLALLGGTVLLATGCSGINASKSFSPASFFLPGLLQADPPPSDDESTPAPEKPVLVAQSR
jgi:hypothetical protein